MKRYIFGGLIENGVLRILCALTLLSCSTFEFNNPSDPANGAVYGGSSSGDGEPSSSSAEEVSSSSSEAVVTCDDWVETPATCDAPGSKTKNCSDGSTPTQLIAKLTWSSYSVTTPATCDATGVETRTCPGNAQTAQTRTLDQLTWGAWTQTTAPTCDTKGEETRTCPGNAQAAQKRAVTETSYANTTHFCFNHKIEAFCGSNKQEYDPSKYECKSSVNPNGIYLKPKLTDSRDSKGYDAVLIGTQIWMAENLNYNATGSKCGNGNSLSDTNTTTCNSYGRLYTWSTALNGSPSSTANPSGVQGVCPSGWHLPSEPEWSALLSYIHTDKNLGNYTSGNSFYAGKYLKATSGWYNCAASGSTYSCLDAYGFAALPGGFGSTSDGDYFSNGDGANGYWWSSSQYNTKAQEIYITFSEELVRLNDGDKLQLLSVRCVKNN